MKHEGTFTAGDCCEALMYSSDIFRYVAWGYIQLLPTRFYWLGDKTEITFNMQKIIFLLFSGFKYECQTKTHNDAANQYKIQESC